jgi:hypothetical protein
MPKPTAPTGARSRIVLHIDLDRESDRARHVFDSHLARTKWMTEHGYRHLLRGGAFDQTNFFSIQLLREMDLLYQVEAIFVRRDPLLGFPQSLAVEMISPSS